MLVVTFVFLAAGRNHNTTMQAYARLQQGRFSRRLKYKHPAVSPSAAANLHVLQVELSCRVATLLLRLHHAQLTATPSARQTLVDLHKRMRSAVQGLRDTLGFNIAALRFLQRTAKDAAGVEEGDAVRGARKLLVEGGGVGGEGGMQLQMAA